MLGGATEEDVPVVCMFVYVLVRFVISWLRLRSHKCGIGLESLHRFDGPALRLFNRD